MGGCSSRVKSTVEFPAEFKLEHAAFQTPADALGQSGGTTTFFSIVEVGACGRSFIGKDVDRSLEEVANYAIIQSWTEMSAGWRRLGPFFIQCLGVLCNFPCRVDTAVETRNLLVLARLGEGLQDARVMDVKIGFRTAVAGWRGKSRLAAWRARQISDLTNSSREGFRVEGVDNQSAALKSMIAGNIMKKKHKRLQLQRLRGSEALAFLIDVNDELKRISDAGDWQILTLCSLLEQLHSLNECLQQISDQMWIGSSVALVVDPQADLRGRKSEGDATRLSSVKMFDWGRSALTVGNSEKFPGVTKYWDEYKQGMRRLLLETAILLRTRFAIGNFTQFPIIVELWDFDVTSADDFIGQVVIPPLQFPTAVGTVLLAGEFVLQTRKNKDVRDSKGEPTIVHIEISDAPSNCGERILWVNIPRARNLPQMDYPHGKADPMVRILVGEFRNSQTSAIIPNTLNPELNAKFAFLVNPEITRLKPLAQQVLATTGTSEATLIESLARFIQS